MESLWIGIPAIVSGTALLGWWLWLRRGSTPASREWAHGTETDRRLRMLVLPTLGGLFLLIGLAPHAETRGIDQSLGAMIGTLVVLLLTLAAMVLFLGFGLLGALVLPVPTWLMPSWARSATRTRKAREKQTRMARKGRRRETG